MVLHKFSNKNNSIEQTSNVTKNNLPEKHGVIGKSFLFLELIQKLKFPWIYLGIC